LGFRLVSVGVAHAALAAFVAQVGEAEAAVAAPPARATLHLALDGRHQVVDVEEIPGGFVVDVGGREFEVRLAEPAEARDGPATVQSPVPGVVAEVHVTPGAAVTPGARLVTLLAMKLQHDVTASTAGTVAAVHVAPGREVQAGEPLVEIAPP
jgi:biotin carboxyl carrier protein